MKALLVAIAITVLTASVAAADPTFRCKGERIEKGSSTWGWAKTAGSDYRIEKGSWSVGWAKKRSSRWAIETFGGSTLGWLVRDRIDKPGGSTWARLQDAKDFADCPDAVAAALWVLKQTGRI